jgi:hypothetical protein
VCRTLVCTERPRYFAGQLLTEAELNSEQTYVLAKNRLHNRFLHGVGVVCGLEVVCHECDGWVTVQPGYAIDPCGNDVVVCDAHDFDVIEAIRRCKQVERQRGECEPYRSAVSERCQDETEHWCLTIRYAEKEARPTTPLLNGRAKCSCGTAHTNGHGCEPTRILESYQLELLCQPDHCAPDLRELLGKRDLTSPLMRCFSAFRTFLNEQQQQEKFSQADLAQVVQVGLTAQIPDLNPEMAQQLNRVCGRFWCFVYALFRQNPLGGPLNNCAVFQTLDALACPPPPPAGVSGSALQDYYRALQANYRRLLDLVFEYLVDCICHQLLPPCATEPCDERLILACLEVRDGKIVRIGNFCCRRFAGSFPAVGHWLSLIPILPYMVELLKSLCCDPDITDFIYSRVSTNDPAGIAVARLSANEFAVPKAYARAYAGRAMETAARPLDFGRVVRAPAGATTVELATMTTQPAEQAEATLREAGVSVVVREIARADDIPVADRLLAPVVAVSGDNLVLYRTAEGKVVGFRRLDVAGELASRTAELDELRRELDTLRAEVNRLRK